MNIIVKRGFDYEKIYYKAGQKVSETIAKLFPEHVKTIDTAKVEVAPVVEEVVEEPVEEVIEEKPKKKNSKKSKK